MLTKFRYHILMHFIIFLWGFTGLLGKLIHIDSLYIVWHRLWIAALSLFIVVIIFKLPRKLPKGKQLALICLTGVFVAAHWLTFYYSIELSTASLGIICLSTATLHVTWLEPLILKKHFSKLEFSFGFLVIFGIYFIANDFNEKEILALIIGLCSALFAAIFSVLNAKLIEETPSSVITLVELTIGLVLVSIVLISQGTFNSKLFVMTSNDFLLLLFLGIVCTSFAFLSMIEVVKRLGAFTASLSINMEPVYTILLAIPLLNENKEVGGNFYFGAGFIVLIVVANAVVKARINKVAPANRANDTQP